MNAAETLNYVATRAATAVGDRLAELDAPVSQVGVYPAALPWDNCECGTVAVAVGRLYLTNNFPAIDDVLQLTCGGGLLAADYVLQVLRCVPLPTDGLTLTPDPDALARSAAGLVTDGTAVTLTLQCLLDELVDQGVIVESVLRPVVFAEPEGACVGSVVNFAVAVVPTT